MKIAKMALLFGLLLSTNLHADSYRATISNVSTQPNDQAYITLGGPIEVVSGNPLDCFYGIIYLAPKGDLPSSKAMLSLAMMLYASQKPAYVLVQDNGVNGGQDCVATQLVALQ